MTDRVGDCLFRGVRIRRYAFPVSDAHPPYVLQNRFARDAVGAGLIRRSEACFGRPTEPARFHGERQDTTLSGWRRLAELVDGADADGGEAFGR